MKEEKENKSLNILIVFLENKICRNPDSKLQIQNKFCEKIYWSNLERKIHYKDSWKPKGTPLRLGYFEQHYFNLCDNYTMIIKTCL